MSSNISTVDNVWWSFSRPDSIFLEQLKSLGYVKMKSENYYNPKTNRKISINGEAMKKIIKKFKSDNVLKRKFREDILEMRRYDEEWKIYRYIECGI